HQYRDEALGDGAGPVLGVWCGRLAGHLPAGVHPDDVSVPDQSGDERGDPVVALLDRQAAQQGALGGRQQTCFHGSMVTPVSWGSVVTRRTRGSRGGAGGGFGALGGLVDRKSTRL